MGGKIGSLGQAFTTSLVNFIDIETRQKLTTAVRSRVAEGSRFGMPAFCYPYTALSLPHRRKLSLLLPRSRKWKLSKTRQAGSHSSHYTSGEER